MKRHEVRVYQSKEHIPKQEQLAYKLAQVATDDVALDPAVITMLGNRIIDNAAVALAAANRAPVAHARAQALAHPRPQGATVLGLNPAHTFDCAWAAWANGTAVRELDMHDTFLAADYSHPGDNIPPVLAVAQQKKCTGADLLRGLAAAYEIHINLVKGICLHKHKKDHIAHLCPAAAAGIGALLRLPTDTVYQAVQQAVHVSFGTRQSRKGEISSWKAYAPAHAGKLAIEAIDRAMRGEKSPSPIYEGEDSVIAYMLDGPQGRYEVPLPEAGEAKRAILESYTKEHSAEYQSQALIDLAFLMRSKINMKPEELHKKIKNILIETSHHTHFVIGSGSGDPQKYDPHASRETLDHSIMYIFAVALEDGRWHHVDSYTPERAARPHTVALWQSIQTVESAPWTAAYHHADPMKRAFGGRVVLTFNDGTTLSEELRVANAHPAGAKPFARPDYRKKFEILTAGLVSEREAARFLGLVERLPQLTPAEVQQLTVALDAAPLSHNTRDDVGIF